MPDGAAACLYAGLVTDTGRFQYQATTPETLRIAAALREHPFDHAALAQALYEDNASRVPAPGAATALARVALRARGGPGVDVPHAGRPRRTRASIRARPTT